MQKQDIVNQIKTGDYELVAIQSPAGLRKEAVGLAKELKTITETILISEPCYGACDLARSKVKALGCDCLVHIGHNPFLNSQLEKETAVTTFYWEYKLEGEPLQQELISDIKSDSLGLLATIQHRSQLDEVKTKLRSCGKQVKIGGQSSKTGIKGQILGCDVTAATQIADKVEAFLLLASGSFHADALQQLGNKVYIFNPVTGNLSSRPGDKGGNKRKEIAKVLKYKDKEKWGILASSKSGQLHTNLIEDVKEKLEALGKETYVFIGNRILERDLKGFGIDIFVNTACPRLTDDFKEITVVNPSALQALAD